LGTLARACFPKYIREHIPYRLVTNAELLGDFLIAHASGNEPGDLLLAWTEQ
jgi:hypothetical protein